MTREDDLRALRVAIHHADEARPIKLKLDAIIKELSAEVDNNNSDLINSVYYLVCKRAEEVSGG